MMTTIGLIRHGITDWNVENRWQGHSDIPLNEQGIAQAKAIARRLTGEQWDVLVASDLSRARHTAEMIGQAINLEVLIEPRLRERFCGEIEGTTASERFAKWGNDWKNLDLGFEDDDALGTRGKQVIEELAATHKGKKILIATHGGLIRTTLNKLIPSLDTKVAGIDNTSLTILHQTSDGWQCSLFNCTTHLDV